MAYHQGKKESFSCLYHPDLFSILVVTSIFYSNIPSGFFAYPDVLICPSFVYLQHVQQLLVNQPQQHHILVGAQNCWHEPTGAFTGEISGPMLKDNKIDWVLLGHSERRHINGESNDLVGRKLAAALGHQLNIVLCLGELLEDRDSGRTQDVVTQQLEVCHGYVNSPDYWDHIVIAYEPVWAIGTGRVASPQQAQEVHLMIRQWLKEHVSSKIAKSIRIIYGGSVNPKNCKELAQEADIDGFLVGGASLVAEQFSTIVDAVHSQSTQA